MKPREYRFTYERKNIMSLMSDGVRATDFNAVNVSNGIYVDGTQVIDASGNAAFPAGSVGTAELADDAVTSAKLNESTIQYAEVSITNAEMLALRATPKTLVAAPGAGKMIEFLSAELLFDYTGAYTETADNMAIKYENGAGATVSETIEATGFVDATADTVIKVAPAVSAALAKTAVENKAIVLHNTGDGEYGGGNASNAVRVKVAYRVHTTGF